MCVLHRFSIGLSGYTGGSQWTHGRLRGRVLWHQHPILLASDSSFPALPMNGGVAVHRTSTRTMEHETFHSTALALFLSVLFFEFLKNCFYLLFSFVDLKRHDPLKSAFYNNSQNGSCCCCCYYLTDVRIGGSIIIINWFFLVNDDPVAINL